MRKRSCLSGRISFSLHFSVSTPDNEREICKSRKDEQYWKSKGVRTCGRLHSMIVLVKINWNDSTIKTNLVWILRTYPLCDLRSFCLNFSYTANTGSVALFILSFWSKEPENKLGAIRFHCSLIFFCQREKKHFIELATANKETRGERLLLSDQSQILF